MSISEILFISSVSIASLLFGFGTAIAYAKKKDPKYFTAGAHDAGVALAFKALRRATVYSVTGVSLLCFGVYKLSGATDLKDFRQKAGSILPEIPKNKNPSRSDFKTLRELMEYLEKDGKS